MSPRAERRLPSFVLPLVALCCFASQVWTFHWGVATYDSLVQYRQVVGGTYEDWHPPITAFVWRWLGGARWGGAPMLLLDCALYWGGFLLLAEALRRQKRDMAALAIIAVGLLPVPFGQMGAILKDALLTACCLAAAGLLALASQRPGRRGGLLRAVAAALLLVAGATRFNAILATAPLLLLALTPALWRRPRLLTLAGLAGCGAVLALASLGVTALLRPKPTEPIYSLVNFDLAGTSLAAGRSLYPTAADPGLAMLATCYSPRLFGGVDYDRCEPIEARLRDTTDRAGGGWSRPWLLGIGTAPLAYLRHRLAHFNRNQRWWVADVPDDAIYLYTEPNTLGLVAIDRPAARLVHGAALAMARSPVGRPATWLAAALGLCLLGLGGRLPPLALALAASALLYGSGYALVSVADDLRYNLWTMLAAMLGWMMVAAQADWTALPRLRRRLALALPLAAVAGEIVALAA